MKSSEMVASKPTKVSEQLEKDAENDPAKQNLKAGSASSSSSSSSSSNAKEASSASIEVNID